MKQPRHKQTTLVKPGPLGNLRECMLALRARFYTLQPDELYLVHTIQGWQRVGGNELMLLAALEPRPSLRLRLYRLRYGVLRPVYQWCAIAAAFYGYGTGYPMATPDLPTLELPDADDD